MTPAQLEDLIRESLQEIVNLPVEPVIPDNKVIATNPGSKLIFPKTRTTQKQDGKKQNDGKRVSEQEARFLFVHKLEQDTNAQCLYSVEAPTKQKYRFSGDGAPKIDPTGQAGNIDVCLYDLNGKRKHLIEFKALNPEQISYSKDFLKLICDEDNDKLTNYFAQVVDNSNIPNIEGKYVVAIVNAQEQAKRKTSPLQQSQVVIFLRDMGIRKGNSQIIKYEIEGNGKVMLKYILNNGNGNWIKVATIPIPQIN